MQPKPAIAAGFGARFGAQPGVPTAHLKPPTAPPVYKPYPRPQAAQPKIIRAAAIQRASSEKSGFSSCDATVTGSTKSGKGAYSASFNIHGEIAALEDYLSNGGTIGDIVKIVISSPPCKYCHIILSDLGIRDKVAGYPSGGGYGSCQGGSYGWFYSGEQVSKAVQAASGKTEKKYIDSVIARERELK